VLGIFVGLITSYDIISLSCGVCLLWCAHVHSCTPEV